MSLSAAHILWQRIVWSKISLLYNFTCDSSTFFFLHIFFSDWFLFCVPTPWFFSKRDTKSLCLKKVHTHHVMGHTFTHPVKKESISKTFRHIKPSCKAFKLYLHASFKCRSPPSTGSYVLPESPLPDNYKCNTHIPDGGASHATLSIVEKLNLFQVGWSTLKLVHWKKWLNTANHVSLGQHFLTNTWLQGSVP